MLLAYPTIETGANWLHDCLVEVLVRVHGDLRAGNEPPAWPEILPVRYRSPIRSRRSLKAGVANYVAASRTLSDLEHDRALSALSAQNRIEELLANEAECERVEALPVAIQEPLGGLFAAAFRLLGELEIRDAHEERLIAACGRSMCPFCGAEYFEPSGVRADLDHYLVRTLYPYASANLENLVPMGKYCNQGFKGQDDMLYDGDGERRIAYFPYGSEVATIDLDESDPGGGRRPSWIVRLVPGGGRAETWDRVFQIRERYAAILRRDYKVFLSEFNGHCCFRRQPPANKSELIESLELYVELQRRYGLADKAFLKAAVFDMLLKYCREGDDDLIEFLLELPSAFR